MDREDVRELAKLSMLAIPEGELDSYAEAINKVICHVKKLEEVNVDGVLPYALPSVDAGQLRPDVVPSPTLTQDQALAMAPESEDGMFKVPPMMEA